MNFTRFVSAALLGVAIASTSMLTACSSTPTQASLGENIDDSVITSKVKGLFVEDKTVGATRINVETFKGVVQLTGFAATQEEINRAVEIARSVKGVKDVKNDIQLRQATASKESLGEAIDDTWITTKVKSSLIGDKVVKARDIKVETLNGIVQLSGFVATRAESRKAAEIARGVKGVKGVKNDIRLRANKAK